MAAPLSANMRVACLLPSASETLAFIGGAHLLVGRSHECDFPASVADADVPVLTSALNAFENSRQMHEAVTSAMQSGDGLYAVDTDQLRASKPDVILTQSLCSVCSIDANVVQRIAAQMPHPQPKVVTLNPMSLQEVITDCTTVGDAVGLSAEGRAAAEGLTRRLDAAVSMVKTLAAEPSCAALGKTVAFLEWTDPLFPGGHWTPQLIEMAGGRHPINPPYTPGGGALPSAEIPVQAVVDCDPDWIILCPCGLDIDTAEAEAAGIASAPWWKGLRAVREGRVALVDGNHMFNRPGPRLLDALEWLVGLLHGRPDLMPAGFPWRPWKQPEIHPGGAGAGNGMAGAHGQSATACEGGVANGRRRIWCAPPDLLPVDIEEAHAAACSSGKSQYLDHITGYMAFTEVGLQRRGHCCGNRCRHCPYGHLRVTRAPRLNLPSSPTMLDSKLLDRCLDRLAGKGGAPNPSPRAFVASGGAGGASTDSGAGSTVRGTVLVLCDSSRLPEVEQLQLIEQQGKVPVLTAVFLRGDQDGATLGELVSWGNNPNTTESAQTGEVGAKVSLHQVQDLSLKAGVPIAAVPTAGGEVCWGFAPREANAKTAEKGKALAQLAVDAAANVVREAMSGKAGSGVGLAVELCQPSGFVNPGPLGLQLWSP